MQVLRVLVVAWLLAAGLGGCGGGGGTSSAKDVQAGDIAGLQVPCTGNEKPDFWYGKYWCGHCAGDLGQPIECVGGRLRCAAFRTMPDGSKVPVQQVYELIPMDDFNHHTGACASVAWLWLPGFRLDSPAGLETARGLSKPLTLTAEIGYIMQMPCFAQLFADEAKGQAAIHALVTLTDMQTGQPVDYAIGLPQTVTNACVQSLELKPAPLSSDGWYRVTVKPGDAQDFVKLVTWGPGQSPLTAPLVRDFYTGSRPMLSYAVLAYKPRPGFAGYIEFQFTEPLAAANEVSVTVDGVPVSTASETNDGPDRLRFDLVTMPKDFKTLELHLPAAAASVNGGTVGAGAKNNPYASIVGNEVVYMLKASDMVFDPTNTVLRWHYEPK